MASQPVVRACAWHPQYFGRERYEIMVPLPPGMTPEAFTAKAVRQHAITHGICEECQPIFAAEIRGMKP